MIEQDLMINMLKHLEPALLLPPDVAEVIDNTVECCDVSDKLREACEEEPSDEPVHKMPQVR